MIVRLLESTVRVHLLHREVLAQQVPALFLSDLVPCDVEERGNALELLASALISQVCRAQFIVFDLDLAGIEPEDAIVEEGRDDFFIFLALLLEGIDDATV